MERRHDDNKICSDLIKSEKELIEAQKKWIENSKTLTNISILEAQRHWLNETITEKEFAERLLATHDESIELNNFTLLSSHSKDPSDSSSKALCQKACLPTPAENSYRFTPVNFFKNCNKPSNAEHLHSTEIKYCNEVDVIIKTKKLIEKKPCPSEKEAEHFFDRKNTQIEESQNSESARFPGPSKNQENHKNAAHITKCSNSPAISQASRNSAINKSFDDNKEEAAAIQSKRFRLSYRSQNSTKSAPILLENKGSEIQSDTVNSKEDDDANKTHHAHKEEMRKFIKQKQKERYEKILQENKLKENEKKEKMKKLELLKQTQKKILENSKMRSPIRSHDKPQWIGPMEGISSKTKTKNLACNIPKLTEPSIKPQTGAIIFKTSAVNSSCDKVTKSASAGFTPPEKKIAHEKICKTREKLKSPVKSRPKTSHHSINTFHCKEQDTITGVRNKIVGDICQTLENYTRNCDKNFRDEFQSHYEENLNLCDSFKTTSSMANDQCTCKCERTSKATGVKGDVDFSKVTRKRRSSKDDLTLNDSELNIKMKKCPPTLSPTSKDLANSSPRSGKLTGSLPFTMEQNFKKSFQQEECLDCLESSIWRKSSKARKPEYTVPELMQAFENMEDSRCKSDLAELIFKNLDENELNKDGFRLEIPASSSSCQSESVDTFVFNTVDRNCYEKDSDQTESHFRLGNEPILIKPSTVPFISIPESKDNISKPVFPHFTTDICGEPFNPDLSKVNTRRSTTSNTEFDTTVSGSLSVDPLRLSASIENINLVTNLVNRHISKTSEPEENNVKESLPRSESEDEFLSKCASRNSNITQLIESIPHTKDDHLNRLTLQEEGANLKYNISQDDSLEKKFLAKCESYNNNVSNIDILQEDRIDTSLTSQEIKKKTKHVFQENQFHGLNELRNLDEQNFQNQSNKKESYTDLQISKNISLRVDPAEHLAQIPKDSLSQNCSKEDLNESLAPTKGFVHIPEICFQDINKSTYIGSSSSNSDRQRNLPSVSTVLSNKDFLPFERGNGRKTKGEKQKLHNDSSLSDHSSSYSEVVKVSRTLSRGSTVISEVSEVHTLSSQSVKYNSSSLHNRIKNEIQQLDRLEENISSMLDTTRISPHKEKEINQYVRKDKPNCSYEVQSVNSFNSCSIDQHTSEGSYPDMVENKKEFHAGLLDLSNVSGFNISTFSLEMLNDLLKDEDLKAEHHAAVMKMREKALIDRAKAEIAYLEMQKRELKEQGRDEEARNIKKKQRGVVVRVDEEIQEIQRIRKAEKNASRERKLLIQQQQQLLKLQMGTKYYSLKRSPSNNKVQRSISNRLPTNSSESTLSINFERGSSLTPYLERKTRELQEKENSLMARKKNIESIVAWKQRLDQEEKKVQEMEKLIALSPSLLPQHKNKAIQHGTSPMQFNIDVKDQPASKEMSESITQSASSQIATTCHSESETQNKEYNSDSFEHSSVMSEQLLNNVTMRSIQNPILDSKRRKSIAALKIPLSPRVTILKRRHSSGSDESILFSQNETLSEQSDMEVRVSALQQQLKMRKAELEKLRKEYNKSQRERLRAKEQSLINQIQAYDTYIEQVKQELQKECDRSDVKVMKPLIKQPKFLEKKKSEEKEKTSIIQEKNSRKEDLLSDSSSIDHSLSPSRKTSSLVESVSEIIEHDSSETIDSVKTQLESRVFDSPEVSVSRELDRTSHAKSSDVLDSDVISVEEYSAGSYIATTETVTENIVEELDTKIEETVTIKEATGGTALTVSENVTNSQKIESQEISPITSVDTFISTSQSNENSHSPGQPVSSDKKSTVLDESNSEDQNISEALTPVLTECIDEDYVKNSVASFSVQSEIHNSKIQEDNKSKSDEEFSLPTSASEPISVEYLESAISENDIQSFKEETKTVSLKEEPQDVQLSKAAKFVPTETEVTFVSNEPMEEIETHSSISSATNGHSLNVSEMVSEIKEQLETISNFLNEDQRYVTATADSFVKEMHAQKSPELLTQSLEFDEKSNEEFSSDVSSAHEMSQKINDKTLSSLHFNFEAAKSGSSESIKSSTIAEQLSVKEKDITSHSQLTVPEEVHSGDSDLSENMSARNEMKIDAKIVGIVSDLVESNRIKNLDEISQNSKEGNIDNNVRTAKNNEPSELENMEKLDEEIDLSSASSQEIQEEFKILCVENDTSQTSNLGNADIIDLLQESFEISDELWKENLENLKNEDTPLLTALQMERQKNLNIDYIWRDICDSCVNEATDAFITAFFKKKTALAIIDGVHKGNKDLQETDKVGDNEGFWLGEELTLQTAREAEQLRLQQLQIEQEIEELEQAQEAVPYYYVREIPNKPPPPYTPPGRVAPTQEEILARVGEAAAILWEVEKSGGDVANQTLPENYLPSQNDQPHRLFLFELAKELYLKARPPALHTLPAWCIVKRPFRSLPKISTKEELLRYMERQTKLVFGYEPRLLRENMIMKWSRKKRDQVDEILIRECQEEEQEWVDFSLDENMVKNQLADAIIDKVLEDAVNGLSLAFTKKFKDDNIS